MNNLRNIYNSIHHNIVVFAKSPASIVVSILPIFILILLGSIYPVVWVLPQIISLSIIIICTTSVGFQYYEYRQTKFFRVARGSENSVFNIVLGTFITTVIFSVIISGTLIVVTWFFTNAIPILNQTIENVQIEPLNSYGQYIEDVAMFTTFSLSNISWFLFFYSVMIAIVMTSLLSIAVGTLFKTINGYVVFSMIYIFIYIIFGGIAIPWFMLQTSQLLTIIQTLIPSTLPANLISSSINHQVQLDIQEYINYCELVSNTLVEAIQSDNPSKIIREIYNVSLQDGYADPLNLALIYNNWPWAKPFMESITAFINQFISSDKWIVADSAYLLGFGLFISKITGNTDEYLNNSWEFFNALTLSINQLSPAYSFDFGSWVGIKSNFLPLIYSAITLPNLILLGGEE